MKPASQRRILYPGVLRTDMVGNLILNNFETQTMGFIDQFSQRREITETIFYGVIINGVVAVIISVRTPRLIAVIHAIPVVVPGS